MGVFGLLLETRRVTSLLFVLLIILPTIYSSVGTAKADSVIATIPVGPSPNEIAFDSFNGNLYVTNHGNNTVSVISGQTNTIIGKPIPVGNGPAGITFDPANFNLYVANQADNSVSVIAPSHSTTLTLNTIANVPSGTKITVTGKLTDNAGTGVAGKSITFTGNGASNSISATTNPDGTFSATGTSPDTVATGWTVQAHFAGDSVYAPADSSVQSYNTVSTTPIPPLTISVGNSFGPLHIQCTSQGQTCNKTFNTTVNTLSVLKAQFTVTTDPRVCSPADYSISVDGGPKHDLGVVGPGGTSALVDLGPVSAGTHHLSLSAVGIQGGCNSGHLAEWDGSLIVVTSPTKTNVGDPIGVSGIATNVTSSDTVTIDWEDGTSNTTNIAISSDGSWGPVFHTYGSSAAGTKPTVIAQLIQSCGNLRCAGPFAPQQITVSTHTTFLNLNPITSTPWGKTVTVAGELTDTGNSDSGIAGKTITFTGTGAGNIAPVTTNPNGTFTAIGTAPTSVNNEWTVQAHFAADSLYGAADSIVESYSTVIHKTTLILNTITNVPSGNTVTVKGKLADNDASNTGVGGKTITFTGTGAGNIAPVTTNPNGTFTAIGTAPTSVNNEWTVQAHFAADSLYGAADSIVESYSTIRTTPLDTTITSAVDGNGVTITNGSTTFSGSIRFTFKATAGTNPIAGFQCSLDNGAFSSCSSPTILTNLAAGKHTFEVRAVDTLGNKDPTPASFRWTIATPPTKTTITSAVDGNSAPVQNGSATLSSSITFTFTATTGTNPIAGFQCNLDTSPFSSCTSPDPFNNLAAGPHKFIVAAVDSAGNKDPMPASFSWTILTPAQGIQQLIQTINGMHLNLGTQTNLDAQLNGILTTLSLPIKNNLLSTCPHLNAFVNTVIPDYLHLGQLNPNQAAQIIQLTRNIQTALGCPAPSSVNGIRTLSASPSMQQEQQPPSLNLTNNQQQQPQMSTSSPLSSQPQSQSPYPYTSQNPTLSRSSQSQSTQNLQLLPVANAGNSQTVNENTKVELDGLASHDPNGGTIVAYQWAQLPMGVPVALIGANTPTPTFAAPVVHTDTLLGFSLKVMDNHGAVSPNPAVVYVMVKHNPNNGLTTGSSGNAPVLNANQLQQPQQQQRPPQPIVPNNLLPTHFPQLGSFRP